MIEDIQGFYDIVYKELKEFITTNSKYKPYVFKEEPESKLFPLVVIKEPIRNGTYTTLKYTDKIYTFNTTINIFAVKSGNISGNSICEELSNIIERFFDEVYKMKININAGMINIDEDVSRTIITISCRVDTKFKDRLVIYPE